MEKEILKVRMLGGFSMVYQEKTLVFDRNYISKSTQLLQILFLHLEKGIAKERLLEELYGRDDVENRNGSLNNTIFRLRKQLEAAGLPGSKYFYLKKGIYYWDSVIPVETDLSVFEKKLEESRKETDEETGQRWQIFIIGIFISKHWKNFAPFSRRNAILRRSTS